MTYDISTKVGQLSILADKNHPKACFLLGQCYLNGTEGVERDLYMAVALIRKSASLGHDPAKQWILKNQWSKQYASDEIVMKGKFGTYSVSGSTSRREMNKKDESKYQRLLNRSNDGDAESCFILGKMLLPGGSSIPSNPQEAISWIEKSSSLGYDIATHWLERHSVKTSAGKYVDEKISGKSDEDQSKNIHFIKNQKNMFIDPFKQVNQSDKDKRKKVNGSQAIVSKRVQNKVSGSKKQRVSVKQSGSTKSPKKMPIDKKKIEMRTCPACGSKMVVRRGRNGGSFWGCTAYPHCNFTEHVSEPIYQNNWWYNRYY